MVRRPGSRSSFIALIAVTVLGVTACNNESATEVVCDRAEDLTHGVTEIDDAVKAGELDDATEAVRELRKDFDGLVRRLNGIDNSAADSIEPLIGPADAAILGLETAHTIDELSTALAAGAGAIDAI